MPGMADRFSIWRRRIVTSGIGLCGVGLLSFVGAGLTGRMDLIGLGGILVATGALVLVTSVLCWIARMIVRSVREP